MEVLADGAVDDVRLRWFDEVRGGGIGGEPGPSDSVGVGRGRVLLDAWPGVGVIGEPRVEGGNGRCCGEFIVEVTAEGGE